MKKATLRQYIAAFGCQLSVMMMGSSFVWFTPLLEELTSDGSRIPMTKEESSWMISLEEIGGIFIPIPAGILVDRLGRKKVLLTSFPLIAISWVLIISVNSIEALYAVRCLQGVAMAIVFTVAPCYLAEISEPSIRGALCGNFQTMWSLGILYAYVTGPFMSYEAYAYANASIAILFVIIFIWAPESPYYLVMKDRQKEARKVLMYFRDTKEIEDELSSIKNTLKMYSSQKGTNLKQLIATKKDRRTLLVVSSVAFVKYMSGMPAILTYITETLSRFDGNESGLKKDYITIIIGCIMLLTSIVSAYVTDAIGRKPLIMLSIAGCIIFNAIAGIYFLFVKLEVPNISDYSWFAYSSIGLYLININLGLAPLLQTLQAECFSSETRGLAGGFISFLGGLLSFIDLKQYQPIEDSVGVYMNYFSFSMYSVIGSIAIFIFMRETAGKTLSEIQEVDEKLMTKDHVPP